MPSLIRKIIICGRDNEELPVVKNMYLVSLVQKRLDFMYNKK